MDILYDKHDILKEFTYLFCSLALPFSVWFVSFVFFVFFLFPHFPKSALLVLFPIFPHLVSKVLTVRRKLTAWSLLNISNTQPVISCRLFFCCLQRNINTALISGRFLLSEFLLLYLSYNLPGGEVIKF